MAVSADSRVSISLCWLPVHPDRSLALSPESSYMGVLYNDHNNDGKQLQRCFLGLVDLNL